MIEQLYIQKAYNLTSLDKKKKKDKREFQRTLCRALKQVQIKSEAGNTEWLSLHNPIQFTGV